MKKNQSLSYMNTLLGEFSKTCWVVISTKGLSTHIILSQCFWSVNLVTFVKVYLLSNVFFHCHYIHTVFFCINFLIRVPCRKFLHTDHFPKSMICAEDYGKIFFTFIIFIWLFCELPNICSGLTSGSSCFIHICYIQKSPQFCESFTYWGLNARK